MSAKEVSHRSVRYRPFRPGDLDVVRDIIHRSFPEEADSHPEVLAEYGQEAYYQPENLLVAEVDGRVVSQMGLRHGDLWLSGRPFPAALVGTVCTHPDYRGQGIGAGMLRYSFGLSRRAGVTLSYLHTIPARHSFYRRLGYAPSVHEQVTMTVDPASLDRGLLRQYSPDRLGLCIRRALPADATILDRLYRETARRGTGAWSRDELFWKRRLAGHPKLWLAGCPDFELLLGPDPLAYGATIREGGRWLVLEVPYTQGAEDAIRRLLAADIIAAEQAGIERVYITLPPWMEPEELFGVFLASAQRKREPVFLRLHDEARFLELAQPILAERADSANLRVSLSVHGTPSRSVELGSGSIPLALSLGPSPLAALFYNGEALGELLEARAVKVRPEGASSLRHLCQLFPPTGAGRFAMDGY
jgi:predicted N-acetyltransferase YhbS